MRSICATWGGVVLMFTWLLATAAGVASGATVNVTGGIAHASDFTTQNDVPFGAAPTSGSVSVNGPAFHASANFAALTDRVTLAATESVNATGAGSPGGDAQLDPVNFTVPVPTPFSVFATLDWTNAASSSIPTSLRAYFRLFANNAEAAFGETLVTANPGQHASLTDFPLLTGTLTPGVNYSSDTS